MIAELKPNTKYKLIDKEGYFAANGDNETIYRDDFVDNVIHVITVSTDGKWGYNERHLTVIDLRDEGKFFEEVSSEDEDTPQVEILEDGMCEWCDPFMQVKREKALDEWEQSYKSLLSKVITDTRESLSAALQAIPTQQEGDCMEEEKESCESGVEELPEALSEGTEAYVRSINERIPDWDLTHPAYAGTGMLPPYTTEDVEEDRQSNGWTDEHYDAVYKLTDEDFLTGEVRLDVYKVAKAWRTGSRDDSGALWHCLKTIARFGDKNSREREIVAMYNQIKGLAREEGVDLG